VNGGWSDLDAYYDSLQARWSVEEVPDYANLVVPNGNGGTPIHRWFRMKEAYSCKFVPRALVDIGLDLASEISVCDPFCGSGTTAVSLAEATDAGGIERATFTGVETNPFLSFVSSVKLAAIAKGCPSFPALAQRVGAAVAQGMVEPAPPPELSTFKQVRYFPPAAFRELLAIKASIAREEPAADDPLAAKLAMLCLASIVEPTSKLRRDGRALRHEPAKLEIRPLQLFLEGARHMEDDLDRDIGGVDGAVHHLDVRMAGHTLQASGPFDLIVFSPPYPNNIDYTEVYKLEAWLLDQYANHGAFSCQRWRTIRSHASLDFGDAPVGVPAELASQVRDLLQPLLNAAAVVGGRYKEARRRTIQGYVFDMLSTLVNLSRATNDSTHLVYAVGNSLHGGSSDDGVLIAADLLIARLAELTGFKIDRLVVARKPSRRRSSSPYLRETVVFARSATAGSDR
jgi:hypothetical protein